ncbi:hypothetical protein [Luteipulveratus halotolerans]|uniref:Uncharacterized protein n=1 Tax=Luteipulveratus halotolerans TaxID=1631356 RepID=A0A0L6CKS9_9MICO|nr:hypothetical protein [Luteipulveratus halotolerans]KNX38240.1 hypothetical protein VV01_15545 [Luteipulveratus halotolerans]
MHWWAEVCADLGISPLNQEAWAQGSLPKIYQGTRCPTWAMYDDRAAILISLVRYRGVTDLEVGAIDRDTWTVINEAEGWSDPSWPPPEAGYLLSDETARSYAVRARSFPAIGELFTAVPASDVLRVARGNIVALLEHVLSSGHFEDRQPSVAGKITLEGLVARKHQVSAVAPEEQQALLLVNAQARAILGRVVDEFAGMLRSDEWRTWRASCDPTDHVIRWQVGEGQSRALVDVDSDFGTPTLWIDVRDASGPYLGAAREQRPAMWLARMHSVLSSVAAQRDWPSIPAVASDRTTLKQVLAGEPPSWTTNVKERP